MDYSDLNVLSNLPQNYNTKELEFRRVNFDQLTKDELNLVKNSTVTSIKFIDCTKFYHIFWT